MKVGDIFHKTAKGQSEIENKSNALTLKQRRVLILVNGQTDVVTLKQFSLCENTVEILEMLIDKGFINDGESTGSAHDYGRRDY